MQNVIGFLKELKQNNNREWFNKNRKRYEESKSKMLFMTELLNAELHKIDPNIPLMDPKDCLFRIFRDVRFSNDKSPYKTNMGSYIAKGGRKSIYAGYYFHIEPGMSFVGGGVYMPQPEPLKAIRAAIYDNPEDFIEIIENKTFKKYFPLMYDDKLKTAPKNFPKDFEHIDLIRYKSYAFSYMIEDKDVVSEKLITKSMMAFKELYKINRFLNESLEKF